MNFRVFVGLISLVGVTQFGVVARGQGDDRLYRDQRERESRVGELTTEEQVKLVAAQKTASEDANVKAALEKRNQAIEEYRAILRATMIKIDPAVAPILDRVALERH